jgi:predicted DNA-binding transcriptional regulator YafY
MNTNAPGPKKMLIVNILDILKQKTDCDHRLMIKEIVAILESGYSMKCDRKAVSRNLTDLMEYDCHIESENGWYYNHEFEDSELRLLIDSLLFSKHIPYKQCKDLIEKLKGLTDDYFVARVQHICNLPANLPQNKALFYTIEVLDEAISAGKQVSFTYNAYGTDKKLHPRCDDTGKERVYIINPYQIAATNGHYYLICNYDKYPNVSNYRLDYITDIKLLDTPVKDMKLVKGLERGLDLPKHVAEHIYMFCGESVSATFRASKTILNDIIDWFGKDVKFSNETADECDVSVRVNANAMLYWALQYGPYVEVLEPKELREQVKEAVAEMGDKYK